MNFPPEPGHNFAPHGVSARNLPAQVWFHHPSETGSLIDDHQSKGP